MSRSKASVGYETYSNLNDSVDRREEFFTPDIPDELAQNSAQFSSQLYKKLDDTKSSEMQMKSKIIKKNLANLLPLN